MGKRVKVEWEYGFRWGIGIRWRGKYRFRRGIGTGWRGNMGLRGKGTKWKREWV